MPMERLFEAVRAPLIGVYRTRFPRKLRPESPARRARSKKCSSTCHSATTPPPLMSSVERNMQDGNPRTHQERMMNLAEGVQYGTGTGNISPAVVEYMQKILNHCRDLEVLHRRLQLAETKGVDNEDMIQEFYRVLRENNVELDEDQELARQIKKLEEAYLRSDTVQKRLALQIRREEEDLQYTRELLENELGMLLTSLKLLDIPDCASRISEHDFPDDEKTEETEQLEFLPVEKVQAQEAAAVSWKQAKNQLGIMRLRFNKHEEFYNKDLADYTNAVATGHCDISRTLFDLTHVAELQELTQDLIVAERRYDEAAIHAVQLGAIDPTPSQSSWFVDQDDDGDELAKEAAIAIARTNMERIEQWKDGLAEEGGPAKLGLGDGEDEDCGGWDVQTVRFGDGISAYAGGRERGKIDKWEELRKEDWSFMLQQGFAEPVVAPTGDLDSTVPKKRNALIIVRARSCTW